MALAQLSHRTRTWHEVVDSSEDDRDYWFSVVANVLHEDVGPKLDLHGAQYETFFVETLELISQAGLIDRLESSFLAFDGTDHVAPENFAAVIVVLLGRAGDMLGETSSDRAYELSAAWRHSLLHRQESDDEFVTVAEVAGIYRVTPQAVYKWINAGKLAVSETPGGGRKRIRRSDLPTDRAAEVASDQLRERLASENAALKGAGKQVDGLARLKDLRGK